MRSLVTGSNGLIGSYMSEKLLSMGDEVCLISRKPNKLNLGLTGNFKLNYGDISDLNFIRLCIKDFKPERIFHFAAQSLPTLSWLEVSNTLRVNIEGTYNLLSSVCEFCPESMVIMTGSSAEYGQSENGIKIKEDHFLEPNSIYGVSKLANYHLTKLLFKTKNLRVIYTRPFFVIGPRKKGDVSSDFARSIVDIERKKIKNLKHGNLQSIRDFVDIDDCVNAFLYLSKFGKFGETYNICSGFGTKIEDLLFEFCKLSQIDINREIDKNLYRPIDELIRIGDPSKLNLLGWKTEVTLEETVEKILNYWRMNY